MSPIEVFLGRLQGVRKAGNGWSAQCPAHEDRRASLSISAGDDGTVLVKCHAGCDASAIVAALGLKFGDLYPTKPCASKCNSGKHKEQKRPFDSSSDAVASLELQHGKRSALWTYHDLHGEPVGVVVRWEKEDGKDIRPVARQADGWRITAMPGPRPLYGLPQLAAATLVVVCEGEKAADAARSLGFTATTSSGGAQAANKTDWRALAGKEVWLMPDNDASGRKYSDSVVEILSELNPAPVIRIVELPGLPNGGDIADFVEQHGKAVGTEVVRAEIEAIARSTEPFRQDDLDDLAFRPFPVKVLPAPLGEFVDAGARAIGCDPSYLALPLLTAIAAAIGNTRRLELKRGWSAPPIVWSAIVGESGTAKTPAFKLVHRAIRERQQRALKRYEEAVKEFEAQLACWEKEMAAWKKEKNATDEPPEKPDPPICERFIVMDTTIEALAPILLGNPRGLLLGRDELAGWIGSFDRYAGKGKSGADASNWLSMFNAESIIVDRKTGIQRTIYVPHAAVCVSGGIQPAILRRALGEEHRESGLAARLLLACPPRKAKSWTEADIDPEAEADLIRLFDRLFELQMSVVEGGELRPEFVRLSAEAKDAWKSYFNRHGIEQADLTGDMAAAWSKLEEYAARLALVIHFTRWAAGDTNLKKPEIVDVVSMKAGIELATWFKHEAKRVYAMLDESDESRDERRLVEWIERRGGTATARQVQQGCRWLKAPGAAETALEKLVKDGRGSWQDVPTTSRGGRPGRAFSLSTSSTVYATNANAEDSGSSVDVDTIEGRQDVA